MAIAEKKTRAKKVETLPTTGDSTVFAQGSCIELKAIPMTPQDFDRETLEQALRLMMTTRRLDDKMQTMLKQGKGYFHIGASGHEAVQVAIGLQMWAGKDWAQIYYRDLALCLTLGLKPQDVLLHHLAKADDPFSGGRQMSEHYCSKELNINVPSADVGSQFLPGLGLGLGIQKEGAEGRIAYVGSGDGATSQGAFHETLNWASRAKAPVFYVVQDNKYAISVPVDEQTAGGSIYKVVAGYEGLARIQVDGTDFFQSFGAVKAVMEHLRAGKGPVCMVADVVRLLAHSASDNHEKYRTKEELHSIRLIDPIKKFEHQLIEADIITRDECDHIKKEIHHQIDEWAAWAQTQANPDPSTVDKYVFFEGDLGLEYEKTVPSGERIVMVDAINKALREEMTRNEKVIVYGQDVAKDKGGVFTATRDLTKLFGEKRCFNAPLAENAIIGTAVGFSVTGFKPVVEIQFADYVWTSIQNMRNMVSTFRYRGNNLMGCPMVIRIPTGGYIHGGLCHSQNIEAFFAHMPGFKIVMPSNAADAKGLLKTAIRMEDPVIFLEHKYLYRQSFSASPEPDAEYLLPLGKAKVVREGTDLTIVTYGALVYKSLSVARALEKEGVSVEVIDIRSFVPLDSETILASVAKTNRVMVVHEDHEFMGFGAEISAQIANKAFRYLDAPVRRVAGTFNPTPFADTLEKAALPQDDDILKAAHETLSY
jgi:2-oxoisovalerate dehydrogenase E1 component